MIIFKMNEYKNGKQIPIRNMAFLHGIGYNQRLKEAVKNKEPFEINLHFYEGDARTDETHVEPYIRHLGAYGEFSGVPYVIERRDGTRTKGILGE